MPGGNVSGAVRVGDTVRRAAGPWTPSVHALLGFLRERGFTEAPAPLGIDDEDREVLTYIEGETVGDSDLWPGWWKREDAMVQEAVLLRRFHDLARDFRPPDNAIWRSAAGSPGPGQMMCHSDWAPYNVVWRDERIVGVIDWDLAYPGDPLEDVAFAVWHWVPFHHPGMHGGWSPDRATRLRAFLDAYGLEVRDGFLERVVERIRSSARRIIELAREGDAGMRRLVAAGLVPDIVSSAGWLETNLETFRGGID